MQLGPQPGVIARDDALHNHPQRMATFVGVLAILGLESGASQLVIECYSEEVQMHLVVEKQCRYLRPPPFELFRYLPEVVKAVFAMDETDTGSHIVGKGMIRFPGTDSEDRQVVATVERRDTGDRVTFDYPGEREANWELIADMECGERMDS